MILTLLITKPLKLSYPKLAYKQAQLYNFKRYNYFTLHKHSLCFPFSTQKGPCVKIIFRKFGSPNYIETRS